MSFDGDVVIITGAGAGLGRAYALDLAKRGAALVLNGRRRVDGACSAEDVCRELVEGGARAVLDDTDVAAEGAADILVEKAMHAYGRVDAFVSNAGASGPLASIQDLSLSEARELMEVNFWSAYLGLRAVMPIMLEQKYGRAVMTSAGAAIFSPVLSPAYAAAKAALIGLARAVAMDARDADVKINLVSPYARTAMSMRYLADPRIETLMSPDRVAPAISWLCSRVCEANGQMFSVGGGRIRRVVVGETPACDIPAADAGACWDALRGVENVSEPRHTRASALGLIPELAEIFASSTRAAVNAGKAEQS